MKVRLFPYKMGSKGAKNLQVALQEEGINCLRVRSDGRYRPRANHLIINWGNSQPANWRGHSNHIDLNEIDCVALAVNKLHTLRILHEAGVSTPTFYTRYCDAYEQVRGYNLSGVPTNPKTIYCRTKLTGHSGEGIVIANSIDELVDAPLYTVGINVKGEYRVHVFRKQNGELEVIDITKKRLRTEVRDNNSGNRLIRNLAGGWVFCHSNVELSDEAQQEVIKAANALGLDFGAVDVVIEKETNKAYVLEVNTAPGLDSPTTVAKYVAAIRGYLNV